ncbi:TPA: hypothetical protein QH957_002278 [Enterobacter bugandensis]|nr:hypothetical protein [Enterobacter bugandensis]
MTIEIHELVIHADIREDETPATSRSEMLAQEERLIARVVERVMRELRYQQEQQS